MALPLIQVQDLIYRGFRIAGILDEAQRAVSKSDRKDGLLTLNSMINGWKAERLMVYAILRSLFSLVANKGTEALPYIIGTDTSAGTPDFLIERPEQLNQASYILQTSPDVEVPLMILNEQTYQSLAPKNLTGPIPSRIYYRPTVPNGTIIIWAVYNGATPTVQLALYTWQTVNEFQSYTDPLVVPPAYREAIEYNLALRLAEQYPLRQKMAQTAIMRAATSLARIKTINAPEALMQCESAAMGTAGRTGHYNILANRYL